MRPALFGARGMRPLSCLLVALTVLGCSSWRRVRITEPAPVESSASARASGEFGKKVRILRADGHWVELRHATMDGDSLRGFAEPGGAPVAYSREDVLTIEARRGSAGKTIALVLGAVVVTGGTVALLLLAATVQD